MRLLVRLSSVIVAAVCWSAPVRADAIDGDWCNDEGGQRISIRGSAVVTPGGTKMEGDYTRHSFSYTSPANEPAGGQTVDMVLLNERNVQVRTGDKAVPPKVWHRCTGTTS